MKIISILALLVFCPSAFAIVLEEDPFALIWYDNWLLGVSAGYATRQGLLQSSITTNSTVLTGYSRDTSDNGWLAAIFGGYQAIHEEWLLGGEINLEWQNIEKTHRYTFYDRQVTAYYRRKGMIDFSGRVGYALTDNFMPYIRAGAEFSRDSLSSHYSGGSTANIQLYNKAWIHRFIVGIGAEMPVPGTCGITLRLEYDYHSKGKTIEDYNATGEGLTRIDYYTALQPRTYSGRLSVVWNFFPA
jgi:opacity protein-like surface antigen